MSRLDDATRHRFPLAAALLDAMDEEVRARRAGRAPAAQADSGTPAALMDAFRGMLPVGLQTEERSDDRLSRLEEMAKVLCDVMWTELVLPLLDMLLLPAGPNGRTPLGTEWRRKLVYQTLGLPFTASEGSDFPLAAHDHEQYSYQVIAGAIGRVEVFKCMFKGGQPVVATLEPTRRPNAECVRLDTPGDHGQENASSTPLLSRHHHPRAPRRLLAPTVVRPEGLLRVTLEFDPRPGLAEGVPVPNDPQPLGDVEHVERKRAEWCRQWRATRDTVWEWTRRLCPAGVECRIVGTFGDGSDGDGGDPLAQLVPDRESIIAQFKSLSERLAAERGEAPDPDREIEHLRNRLREADQGGRVLDWGFRLA